MLQATAKIASTIGANSNLKLDTSALLSDHCSLITAHSFFNS